jgi:ABC-type sulfate transport system permease component
MRKYLIAIALIVIFLVVFIPLASTRPDGLEKVAESLGIEEITPLWNGLMTDYSVGALGNSYASTLLAGVFGTVLVLLASLVLGRAVTKKTAQT